MDIKLPNTESDKIRKPYEAPVLKIYGDLKTITKAVAMNSPNADGGTGQTNKSF